MSADEIAVIRPAIGEVYSAPTDDWCATFVIPDTECWIQVVQGTVNLYYPFADDPVQRLGHLIERLPDVELTDWEPGTYATFSHSYSDNLYRDIAGVVDALFQQLEPTIIDSYKLDVSFDEL